jgi:hypothetical protein
VYDNIGRTSMHIRKLLSFADAVGMPRKALAPLILGQPDATLDSGNETALWEVNTEGMDRREFTTLAAGLAASAVLPVPARVDRAHVRYPLRQSSATGSIRRPAPYARSERGDARRQYQRGAVPPARRRRRSGATRCHRTDPP